MLGRPECRGRRLAGRAQARRGEGAPGPLVGFGPGNFSGHHDRPAKGRRSARAYAVAGRWARARRSDRCRAFRANSPMLKWPNDLLLLGKKLAGILLERSGDRVAVGFGVNLAERAVSCPTVRSPHSMERSRPEAFAPLLASKFRAAARSVANERKLGACSGLAGARASPRHAADRAPRQGRGDRRPLRRARARWRAATYARRRFDRGHSRRRRKLRLEFTSRALASLG